MASEHRTPAFNVAGPEPVYRRHERHLAKHFGAGALEKVIRWHLWNPTRRPCSCWSWER